jgi:septal ring factor EnvC (AmiA/AmiB activator)
MSHQKDEQLDKLEAELKKVLTERDQVIVQLDKSQEMLIKAEDNIGLPGKFKKLRLNARRRLKTPSLHLSMLKCYRSSKLKIN